MKLMSPGLPRNEVPTAAIGFHTTHWTMVLSARNGNDLGTDALANLCASYWYPIYAFIRRNGSTPHEAEDLTQEFFSRVLQRDWLAKVHPTNGKFRSYVLACLKNFLSNERDKALAQRRGGCQKLITFEGGEHE